MRVDFTSSLYLGFQHDSASLPPWRSLTTGKPAVLGPEQPAAELAVRVASLAGCAAGLLFPSTLHLFWDLFVALGAHARGVTLHYDAALYPVARWGVERAVSKGARGRSFRHHEPEALRRALQRDRGRPIIVTDGFCVGCGCPAPLTSYARLARERGGYLVIDDTQAFGVLGRPRPGLVFGQGGGGSLQRQLLSGPEVIWGASLAKGFGVPLAVLAGSPSTLSSVEAAADTRVHCSPPSQASQAALARALDLNVRAGKGRRARLAERTLQLRKGFAALGCPAHGQPFPFQRLAMPDREAAIALHRQLLEQGVTTVLTSSRCGAERPSLSWLVSATHSPLVISLALERLGRALSLCNLPLNPHRIVRRTHVEIDGQRVCAAAR